MTAIKRSFINFTPTPPRTNNAGTNFTTSSGSTFSVGGKNNGVTGSIGDNVTIGVIGDNATVNYVGGENRGYVGGHNNTIGATGNNATVNVVSGNNNNTGFIGTNTGTISSIGGHNTGVIKGEGPVVEQERKADQKFDKVVVHGGINTVIDADEKSQGIRVQAQENLQDVVKTSIQDGVLHIKSDGSYATRGAAPTVLIDMDGLSNLSILGSGDAHVKDLNSPHLNATINGSGDISVEGHTDKLNVYSFGSGDFEGRNLSAKTANVNVTGSGDADVNVTDELTVRSQGSGDVGYTGGASLSQTVTGSGEVMRRP